MGACNAEERPDAVGSCSAGMQNLQGYFAAFLMYRFGNGAMVWDLAGVVEHCATFHANAC